MNKLPLILAAGCGLVFASFAPLASAAPTVYQATGPITAMTDSTITIMYHGKEAWEFAKDAAVKPADGAEFKIGDKVTVHYTMTATAVDASKPASKEHKAPMDKPKKAAMPAATPTASISPVPSPQAPQ